MNKIHFQTTETIEEIDNRTHTRQHIEYILVPGWVAKRAEKLVEDVTPECMITTTDGNVIEFVYGTTTDNDDWEACLDGAYDMFLAALDVDRFRLEWR